MANLPPADQQFNQFEYRLPEIEHRYGENVHLLADPVLLSQLATLCAESTTQPLINHLVESIYRGLLTHVVNREFPRRQTVVRTRMAAVHPEGYFQGPLLEAETSVVSVDLARAGTLPSHVCYSMLNHLLQPAQVRQDHIAIARATDEKLQVIGSVVSGHKIGGPIDGSILLYPDPMAATGSTLCETLDLYKKLPPRSPQGKARKFIALHCIVTPEYLRAVRARHPELIVYAVRLDRGLSPAGVLATVPGTHWDQERGLNDNQYIVPGGGGFGEILNNAYV